MGTGIHYMKNSDIVGVAPEGEKWHICTLSIDYNLLANIGLNIMRLGLEDRFLFE